MDTVLPPQTTQSSLKKWDYIHLGFGWIAGVISQVAFLPCLCSIGDWRLEIALWFDAAVLLRMAAAFYTKQTGNGWVLYTVLCYTSAFWLLALTEALLLLNGKSH